MTRVHWFARRFPTQEAAKAAWQKVHDVLETASDLSVSCYCLQRLATRQWCVAIVGRPPPESRQQQFINLCEGGVPARLTERELVKRTQMRLRGAQEGRWVVKHHRKPGKYI